MCRTRVTKACQQDSTKFPTHNPPLHNRSCSKGGQGNNFHCFATSSHCHQLTHAFPQLTHAFHQLTNACHQSTNGFHQLKQTLSTTFTTERTNLLWGKILRLPNQRVGLGPWWKELGHAEVDQLDVPVRSNADAFGEQITKGVAEAVHVVQAQHDIGCVKTDDVEVQA